MKAAIEFQQIEEAQMHTQRWGLSVLAASIAALLAGSGVAQGAQNVARGALAVSSTLQSCTLGSGPENAVDGAASNIYTDKWCVLSGRPTLTLTLLGSLTGYTVSSIVVKHAGAAGESAALNTRAFRLLATTQLLSAPVTVATVTANTAYQTTHPVNLENVSEVQLVIDTPTQGTNQATRIYEVEVWGDPTPPPPPPPAVPPLMYYNSCMYYYADYEYCCWNSFNPNYNQCYQYVPGWYAP
jgi:hypothetical protein